MEQSPSAKGSRDDKGLSVVQKGSAPIPREIQRSPAYEHPLTAAVEGGMTLMLTQVTGVALGLFASPSVAAVLAAMAAAGTIQHLKNHRHPRARHAGHWGEAVRAEVDRAAGVAPGDEGASDAAWSEFLKQASDPDSDAALSESLEVALRVLDNDAAACVGRLGQMYAAQRQFPDPFFRGCANFLRDANPDELRAVRTLCVIIQQGVREDSGPAILSPHAPRYPSASELRNALSLSVLSQAVVGQPLSPMGTATVETPDPHRVILLLKNNGLVRAGDDQTPATMAISDAFRIARVMGAPPQA